ncbi:MAG: DUF1592 domain-containing protein [Myxococcaceae bacterium]|nr:DUF1592 domain-containing protein [Myxococcaceae bacterium]
MSERSRLLSFLLLLAACDGEISSLGPYSPPPDAPAPVTPSGPGGGASAPGGGTASGGGGETPVLPPPALQSARVRRLSNAELDLTFADLLGDTTHPGRTLEAQNQVLGFDNQVQSVVVNANVLERLTLATEGVAQRATANLPVLLGCDAAAQGEPCVRSFLVRFGRRAFRRPLSTEELDGYLAFFRAQRQQYALDLSVESLLTAVLLSPDFLFRIDAPTAAAAASGDGVFDPYVYAARLSFLLWGTGPDDALLDDAARGTLATPAGSSAAFRRLLADDRAKAGLDNFHRQWLQLAPSAPAKDPLLTPRFAELWPAMREETATFAHQVLARGDGTLGTLLAADFTYVASPLDAFYGLPAQGSTLTKASWPAGAPRSGILTQAAVLASNSGTAQTNIPRRGRFVLEQLLCSTLGPPPNDVPPLPPSSGTAAPQTYRQRLVAHTTAPQCSGCHRVLNPLAFAFEGLGPTGAARTEDQGLPVDTSGSVTLGGRTVTYAGPKDFTVALAAAPEVRRCVGTQWFRYALGRDVASGDLAWLDPLQSDLASRGDLRGFLEAFTAAPFFRAVPKGQP